MSKPLRIVFMGTPDFAVQSLRTLVESGQQVVAVITAPDKPAGRGQKIHQTPVKLYATEQGIPVLQPERLKNKAFLAELASYNADLQVVVAFRMLPQVVWSMPRLGTFNLHASLLPQFRGAAPINWAIMSGEPETGVTTFFLQHEIDTGHIIFQEKTPIAADETAGTLHDRLMHIGAQLVLQTVEAITAGKYPQVPQNEEVELKSAPKLFKENTQIDWQQSRQAIYNLVRGLSPYPAAWTTLQGKNMKVYRTSLQELPKEATVSGEWLPGIAFETDQKTFLRVQTADGWLYLEELQLEGKKRMAIEEFLRGYRFG